jgi:hypothetical protein
MHALSEQFLLLDKMRAVSRVRFKDWAAKAGILWVRFLEIKVKGQEPTQAEISNLQRALEQLSVSRPSAPSKQGRSGTTAAHRVTSSAPFVTLRDPRSVAPPSANSGEG